MKKALTRILLYVVLIVAGLFIGKFLFEGDDYVPTPVSFNYDPSAFSDSTDSDIEVVAPMSGEIIEVRDGDMIQDAVNRANPGDLIRVYPGKYKETVYIDKDVITFQGVIQEGEWPTLDGEKELNDAFLYSGNSITIENFKIVNYKGNAIMGQAGNNFVIRNNWIIDTGVYGIFPEFGKNGLIEHNILSGIEDAAIYVGMCDNIDVRNNEVFDNVAGIEIENTRHALVENNYCHNNTGGILVFITPGLPIKTTYDVIVRNNFVVDNNHENFGAPGSLVSMIPKGTGILVLAADDVVMENNIISGNDNAGITITDLNFISNMSDPDVEPNPDRLVILDNFMINNGNNPGDEVKAVMLTQLESRGPDIIAVGGGEGNTIRNKGAYRTFGVGSWPEASLTSTRNVKSYMLDKPVAPRKIEPSERGKLVYYGICAGCHAYNMRMIGPPTCTLQALYKDNAQGIADYIANPVKKRDDYPEMPPQDYIDEKTRLAVAEYMLSLTE